VENVGEMVACTKKQNKKYSENKTHHNVHNSYGTSSTMKHEGFHLGLFLVSFVFKKINHSTKSLHV
jgi:hypothetical protein